jgi:hypothetical protein
MRLGSALMAVHSALAQALYKDLPDISYTNRDWTAWHALSKEEQDVAIKHNQVPMVQATRRPREDDVEVLMFPQTWGSTALGYGGMGGASVTSAYTVVVHDHTCWCVYFGEGELAYLVQYSELSDSGKENLRLDIQNQNMADRQQSHSRYLRKQVQP